MKDPMIVRLSSGEELIGYIQPSDKVTWLKDPAIMIFDKDGLRLYKYMPYAKLEDKGLPLKNERIDWIVEPELDLAVNYAKWHFDVIENPGVSQENFDLDIEPQFDSSTVDIEANDGSGLKLVKP